MRLLIMGPPGAGKGTQATRITEHYGVPAISTGEIFRDQVKRSTQLGLEVKRLMDAGEYVPDEITNAIVAERLDQPDAERGFLLDGFPRTADQVRALTAMLEAKGVKLDAVISLAVDTDELVKRMLHRAEIENRPDDNEQTIRHRMEVYHTATEPVLALYREAGNLIEIDGEGTVDDVFERVRAAIDARA